MANLLQDDKGNYSSLRFIMVFSIVLLVYQLLEFRYAFRLEVIKTSPDYQGLALIFTATIINFVLVILLKVIQKKFER